MSDIASQMNREMGLDYNAFMELCRSNDYISSLGIDAPTLEGYLYPDTYRFLDIYTERDVIQIMVDEFQKRRDVLVECLLGIPSVDCYKPAGSFYTFPNFSAFYGKSFKGKKVEGSTQLAKFLLEEGKVALVPGIAFGADKNLRMAFACSTDNIKQGVERITKTLELLE